MASKNLALSANRHRCLPDFSWALKRIFKKQNWLSFNKSSYRFTWEVCRVRGKRPRLLSKRPNCIHNLIYAQLKHETTNCWRIKQRILSYTDRNAFWVTLIASHRAMRMLSYTLIASHRAMRMLSYTLIASHRAMRISSHTLIASSPSRDANVIAYTDRIASRGANLIAYTDRIA